MQGTLRTQAVWALSGVLADQYRFPTYYINCHQLMVHFENRLPNKLKVLAKYRMLIIDEIGYLHMDIQGANLFFSSLPDSMRNPPPRLPLTRLSPSGTCLLYTSPSPRDCS